MANGNYQRKYWDEYFKACKRYLKNDDRSDSDANTETVVRDTFYLERNCENVDFLSWFKDKESLASAKGKIEEVLKSANRKNSNLKNDIKAYSRCLDYFYKFLHEKEKPDNLIAEIIEEYKENFKTIDEEERYKWEAINHYKKYWNIEAEDFASMFSEAFKEHYNLLASSYYYPYAVMIEFAKNKPEEARDLFRTIHDESKSLEERYSSLRTTIEGYVKVVAAEGVLKWRNSFQDLHAFSVYLTFEYPEKYSIYKYGIFKHFMELIDYHQETFSKDSEINKLANCNALTKRVLEEVVKDEELCSLSRNRLTDKCYQDENYNLLATDIIYFARRIKKEKKSTENIAMTDIAKNTILYGPPGTGKTYNTVVYAVAIIENKTLEEVMKEAEQDYTAVKLRYDSYKNSKDSQIEFTTFHQSYSYEEFIEGIKPRMEEDSESQLEYKVAQGVFKSFCDRATISEQVEGRDYGLNDTPAVWKVSLKGTYQNEVRKECLENGHIRIGWDSYGEELPEEIGSGKAVLNAFVNRMRVGDIVLSCYTASTIDAVGVVTGEYEWHDEYPEYKRLRKVNWIAKGFEESIVEINNNRNMTLSTVYQMSISVADALKIVKKYTETEQPAVPSAKKNYVFIIDEINRGNISKIFGELITLIETTKRVGEKEEVTALLPYSGQSFGVPNNVYILGTMNTADRSIALMDTALRRRFDFVEMMPNTEVLRKEVDSIEVNGEELNVADMLNVINKRIEYLYDREHTIGHAFFMELKENPTIDKLAGIFKTKVIPLLQEYFYEDYGKIQLVLGDNNKTGDNKQYQFIRDEEIDITDLFEGNPDLNESGKQYYIQSSALNEIMSYKLIGKGL